jgi:hypothetical protein
MTRGMAPQSPPETRTMWLWWTSATKHPMTIPVKRSQRVLVVDIWWLNGLLRICHDSQRNVRRAELPEVLSLLAKSRATGRPHVARRRSGISVLVRDGQLVRTAAEVREDGPPGRHLPHGRELGPRRPHQALGPRLPSSLRVLTTTSFCVPSPTLTMGNTTERAGRASAMVVGQCPKVRRTSDLLM